MSKKVLVRDCKPGDIIRIEVDCLVTANNVVNHRLNGSSDIRAFGFIAEKTTAFNGANGYVTVSAEDKILRIGRRKSPFWTRVKKFFRIT